MEERKTAVVKVAIPFVSEESPNAARVGVVGDRAARMGYLDALALEAESIAEDFEDFLVRAISIEGPMPSIMSPDGLGGFLRRLSTLFNMDPACEISIAAIPHTVGVPSLTGWGLGKVNRISLKAGSLQAAELSSLKAPYGLSDIQNALLFFDKFRLNNVDVELLVGIPGQSESSLLRSIRSLTGIDVPHVTLRPFSVGGGDSSRNRILFDAACERLISEGYEHYSPGRFVRKEAYSSLLVRSVSQGAHVIGMGLGALTVVDGLAYRNTVDYGRYVSAPGDPSIVEGVVRLDEFHASALAVGRSLMLSRGVASSLQGKCPNLVCDELLALEREGIVARRGDSWVLTEDGFFSWLFGKSVFSIMEAARLLG